MREALETDGRPLALEDGVSFGEILARLQRQRDEVVRSIKSQLEGVGGQVRDVDVLDWCEPLNPNKALEDAMQVVAVAGVALLPQMGALPRSSEPQPAPASVGTLLQVAGHPSLDPSLLKTRDSAAIAAEKPAVQEEEVSVEEARGYLNELGEILEIEVWENEKGEKEVISNLDREMAEVEEGFRKLGYRNPVYEVVLLRDEQARIKHFWKDKVSDEELRIAGPWLRELADSYSGRAKRRFLEARADRKLEYRNIVTSKERRFAEYWAEVAEVFQRPETPSFLGTIEIGEATRERKAAAAVEEGFGKLIIEKDNIERTWEDEISSTPAAVHELWHHLTISWSLGMRNFLTPQERLHSWNLFLDVFVGNREMLKERYPLYLLEEPDPIKSGWSLRTQALFELRRKNEYQLLGKLFLGRIDDSFVEYLGTEEEVAKFWGEIFSKDLTGLTDEQKRKIEIYGIDSEIDYSSEEERLGKGLFKFYYSPEGECLEDTELGRFIDKRRFFCLEYWHEVMAELGKDVLLFPETLPPELAEPYEHLLEVIAGRDLATVREALRGLEERVGPTPTVEPTSTVKPLSTETLTPTPTDTATPASTEPSMPILAKKPEGTSLFCDEVLNKAKIASIGTALGLGAGWMYKRWKDRAQIERSLKGFKRRRKRKS